MLGSWSLVVMSRPENVLYQIRLMQVYYRLKAYPQSIQAGLAYYKRQDSWDQAIGHYMQAYKYNPKFISALSTIAYCYQQKKDYKQAVEWYEKYLKVAKPGSKGYDFAADYLAYVKSELYGRGPVVS